MAVDMFLKITGVEGESEDKAHKGEIQILSWNWGESNSGSASFGSGHGTGKVNMQDFSFSSYMNKSTPTLMLACAAGTHFDTAILTCRKQGDVPQEYLKITFTDVIVSSYQTGQSSGGDELPVETFSLNFTKVQYEYKPQNKDGSLGSPVKAGYDVKQNTKV